ncbi:MAG TPA: lysophospholipid acyltransferase family protein [Planctomycetota bacterium]
MPVRVLPATEPVPREWSAAPGSRLRATLGVPFAALWVFGVGTLAILHSYLMPAQFRRNAHRWLRAWGRGVLTLTRICVETHGLERIAAPGPRILAFNHVSVLDLFVLTAIWHEGTKVLYKKEFHRIPVIGRGMRVLGFLAVDRSDPAAARASIDAAAELIREQGATVLLAPEGTRSRTGDLQEFKMGPFHLAAATHVPLVPVIMRGIEPILPGNAWLPRAGTVRIDFLPPVATDDWFAGTVRLHAARLRADFLQYLPAAPGTRGRAPA